MFMAHLFTSQVAVGVSGPHTNSTPLFLTALSPPNQNLPRKPWIFTKQPTPMDLPTAIDTDK